MVNSLPDAIILAGGPGTRLQDTVPGLPKSMAPVGGRPFLEYLFRYLENNHLNKVVLSLGYMPDPILQHFGQQHGNISIQYIIEDEPLGTGGALMKALAYASSENLVVMNGDTLFDVDIQEMLRQHVFSKAAVTIALLEVQDASRYGIVQTRVDGRITSFNEKQPGSGRGIISGGIYIIQRDFIEKLSLPHKFSLENDLFRHFFSNAPFYGYFGNGYFIDIGIPSDYRRACEELPDIIRL